MPYLQDILLDPAKQPRVVDTAEEFMEVGKIFLTTHRIVLQPSESVDRNLCM